MTEFGFREQDTPTPGQDAVAIEQHCQSQAACAHTFYFNIWDGGHDDGADAFFHPMALLRDDTTPKPMYCTLRRSLVSQEAPLDASAAPGC